MLLEESKPQRKKLEMWRNGAEFLWKNEDELPPQPTEASEALLDSDEGVKRAKITVGVLLSYRKISGSPCFNAVLNGVDCED